MRRLLIMLLLAAAVLSGQETLSKANREKLLQLYPLSEAEKIEVRKEDVILKKNNEKIVCMVVGINDTNVFIRLEGLKIGVPLMDIKRVLLGQDLFAVFGNRLLRLRKGDFEGRYAIGVEALTHAEEDGRFTAWAESVLKDCAERGSHLGAYIQVADLQVARGNYNIADLYYSKAIEIDSDSFEAISKFAKNLRHQKKYAKAEKWYREAVRQQGENIAMLEGLAYILLKRGQPAEAKPFYLRVLQLDPEYASALPGYGLVVGHEGRLDEARALSLKAAENGDTSPEALLLLGMLDYSHGRLGPADSNLLKALARSAPSEQNLISAFISMVNSRQGDFDKNDAIFANFNSAETLSYPDIANAIGYHHLKKGESLLADDKAAAQEEFTQAEKAFRKGIGNLESNYYALYGVGMACLHQGKTKEGLEFLGKVSRSHPDMLFPQLVQAEVYSAAKDYDRAADVYTGIMSQVMPDQIHAFTQQTARAAAGDDPAPADLQFNLRRTREFIKRSYLGAVRTAILRDDLKTGAEYAGKLQDVLDCQEAYDYLGYIAFTEGDIEKAKEVFEKGKDKGSLYSKRRFDELLLAQNQREIFDDFNRDDDDKLHNNWDEKEPAGIDIRIAGQRVLFEGGVSRAWAQTLMSQSYSASTFVSSSVNLQLDKDQSEFICGMFIIGKQNRKGVFVIRHDKGAPRFGNSDLHEKGKAWPWKSMMAKWPATETVNLSMKQVDRPTRKFELYINDKKVHTITCGSLIKEEYFPVGCFTQADKGKQIKVWFDDFRVIEEKN